MIAWLYGPIGSGADDESITCFAIIEYWMVVIGYYLRSVPFSLSNSVSDTFALYRAAASLL